MKKNKAPFIQAALLGILISALASSTANAKTDIYYVQPGDTLWNISKKYQVDLVTVVKANPQLTNPDLIYPKEKIYVPYDDYSAGKIGMSMADIGDGSVKISSAVAENAKAGITSKAAGHPYEVEIARLVNQERDKHGLPALTLRAELSNIARIKSEDMRDSKYFDHNSPIYGSPFDMLMAFGVKYKTAGENIASGQKTPSTVINAWMDSAAHRKIILNPTYQEIGVGFVTNSQGVSYWTQMFLSR